MQAQIRRQSIIALLCEDRSMALIVELIEHDAVVTGKFPYLRCNRPVNSLGILILFDGRYKVRDDCVEVSHIGEMLCPLELQKEKVSQPMADDLKIGAVLGGSWEPSRADKSNKFIRKLAVENSCSQGFDNLPINQGIEATVEDPIKRNSNVISGVLTRRYDTQMSFGPQLEDQQKPMFLDTAGGTDWLAIAIRKIDVGHSQRGKSPMLMRTGLSPHEVV